MVNILQANLNHARQAQDLFVHNLVERGYGLGIAESYEIPKNHSLWMVFSCGLAAITSPQISPLHSDKSRGGIRGGASPSSVFTCHRS